MADETYDRLLAEVVRTTRNDGLQNAILGVVVPAVNFGVFGHQSWWVYLFSAILVILAIRGASRWIQLRDSLVEPSRLTRARLWPTLPADKFPPNYVPHFVQVFVRDRSLTLKLDKATAKPFLRALRERAPNLGLELPSSVLDPSP